MTTATTTARTARTRRSIRVVPALALASAVIVVSVAGSATAARLITGKQVKNGSITSIDVKNANLTGVDVKDGSLTRADLRAASRTSVVSAPGGDIGLFIPTCDDTGLTSCPALRTIAIVPGSQLVTATATIDNVVPGDPSKVNRCGLVQGESVLAEARFSLSANGTVGENEHFSLQQVVTVPDSSLPVSLRCTEMDGENLQLPTAQLTSVRTGF